MANIFLDSSALVKRYASEPGSGWILSLFRPAARHTFYLSKVTPVETVAGVARQNRIGAITTADVDRAIRRIQLASRKKFILLDVTQTIVDDAITLVTKHGLRGYDSIQLSTALSISARLMNDGFGELIFVSGDHSLNKAAASENLRVEDPNDHQ